VKTNLAAIPAAKEVLVRLLGSCFLLSACLVGAGCAYGSDLDGFGSGEAPIDTSDSGTGPVLDSGPPPTVDSGPPADSAPPEDTATPFDSAPPDTSDPADTSRPDIDTGGSTCTLDLPTGIPACDTCVSANCCSADDTCGSDTNCISFIECMDSCEGDSLDGGPSSDAAADGGVAACMNACQTEYPTGASELAALDSCLEGACATACE
jgi:hypothetical protein